ncbi:TetR/AcrR family transcriptional regulator [Pseudonocardia acaciae]|uniref:TetR/AcrR family transcriptional regulator n=1 Tax=Pseudonocardia acaciae TaxID=551276 RepID=UPI00048DA263|nr:TetR/AcrR family transcriptional regulator [Pseudonocardia acaciae]
MGTAGPRLREIKKQETRDAIAAVATRLFGERGFENVTIAEIAAAARVSKMTVTNYFARKEDLAIDAHEQVIDDIVRPVAERADGVSVLAAARAGYARRLADRAHSIGLAGPTWTNMISSSRALQARLREIFDQAEHELAGAIATQTGDPGPLPKIVAAQLVAVDRVLFAEAQAFGGAGRNDDDTCAALAHSARTAYDLLEPALGRYGTTR